MDLDRLRLQPILFHDDEAIFPVILLASNRLQVEDEMSIGLIRKGNVPY